MARNDQKIKNAISFGRKRYKMFQNVFKTKISSLKNFFQLKIFSRDIAVFSRKMGLIGNLVSTPWWLLEHVCMMTQEIHKIISKILVISFEHKNFSTQNLRKTSIFGNFWSKIR